MDSLTIHPSDATDRQLLLAIHHRLETTLMPEIDQMLTDLRTAIVDEVTEAISRYQGDLDAALAQAETAEEARAIAQEKAGRLTAGIGAQIEEVRAEGLIGQDVEEPEDPDDGEPTDPDDDGEPTDPDEPTNPEEPTDPDEVVF